MQTSSPVAKHQTMLFPGAKTNCKIRGKYLPLIIIPRDVILTRKKSVVFVCSTFSKQIVQIMADVFGADVFRFEVSNSAALGAAMRAAHAEKNETGKSCSWEDLAEKFASPVQGSKVTPDPENHKKYMKFVEFYSMCEKHALGQGEEPGKF